MVTLPAPYAATKYAGYFFNVEDKKLYSLKIDGILKPLKFTRPNHFNKMVYWRKETRGGYYVSVKGRNRLLLIEDLLELKVGNDVIPVKEVV